MGPLVFIPHLENEGGMECSRKQNRPGAAHLQLVPICLTKAPKAS